MKKEINVINNLKVGNNIVLSEKGREMATPAVDHHTATYTSQPNNKWTALLNAARVLGIHKDILCREQDGITGKGRDALNNYFTALADKLPDPSILALIKHNNNGAYSDDPKTYTPPITTAARNTDQDGNPLPYPPQAKPEPENMSPMPIMNKVVPNTNTPFSLDNELTLGKNTKTSTIPWTPEYSLRILNVTPVDATKTQAGTAEIPNTISTASLNDNLHKTTTTAKTEKAKVQNEPISNDSTPREKMFYILQEALRHGYTKWQAAGIIGNFMKEAGQKLDTNPPKDPQIAALEAQEGLAHHDYKGLAQWAGNRKTNLTHFAAKKGKSEFDFAIQVAFVFKELKDTAVNGAKELKQTKTPAEAAQVFCNRFERPREDFANIPLRQEFADIAFKILNTTLITEVPVSSSHKHPNHKSPHHVPPHANSPHSLHNTK